MLLSGVIAEKEPMLLVEQAMADIDVIETGKQLRILNVSEAISGCGHTVLLWEYR